MLIYDPNIVCNIALFTEGGGGKGGAERQRAPAEPRLRDGRRIGALDGAEDECAIARDC